MNNKTIISKYFSADIFEIISLKANGASLLVSYFNGEDGMALVLLIIFEVIAIFGGICVW